MILKGQQTSPVDLKKKKHTHKHKWDTYRKLKLYVRNANVCHRLYMRADTEAFLSDSTGEILVLSFQLYMSASD